MDPRSHRQLCDEDVATLREEYWGFSTDHLDLWIRFHDLLDTSERQLMQLVVVIVSLQPSHLVLPIRVEDVSVWSAESL